MMGWRLKREGAAHEFLDPTGIATVLFGCGIVALFAAMFRDAAHGGLLLWIGLGLLAATVACWFAAANAEGARS